MDLKIDLTTSNIKVSLFENEIELIETKQGEIVNRLSLIFDFKDLIRLEKELWRYNQNNNPYYEKYCKNIFEIKDNQIKELVKENNKLRRVLNDFDYAQKVFKDINNGGN